MNFLIAQQRIKLNSLDYYANFSKGYNNMILGNLYTN